MTNDAIELTEVIDPKLAEQFEEYRLSLDKRLRKMAAEQLAEEEAFFAERCREIEEDGLSLKSRRID
jgi:hypothetical protein